MKSICVPVDCDGCEIKNSYHAESHGGDDHTLCGLGNVEDFQHSKRKINCPDCIDIIEHCKDYKKNIDYSR